MIEPSYLGVRCSGLFEAIVAYAGTDRLGQETSNQYLSMSETFFALAVQVRVKQGVGSVEHVSNQTVSDIRSIRDIYVSRMKKNYIRSGQAILSDQVIQDDTTICAQLAKS